MERLNSISVVIPTYNRKSQLKECLDSLTRQSYPTSLYEVIVVDDGSTDGTEDFLANYAKDVKVNFIFSNLVIFYSG